MPQVLILIFLENALRQNVFPIINQLKKVLILIFLENALRLANKKHPMDFITRSLNPYFFGKCSTAVNFIQPCKSKTYMGRKPALLRF